jgi:hypothetical protein
MRRALSTSPSAHLICIARVGGCAKDDRRLDHEDYSTKNLAVVRKGYRRNDLQ